MENPKRDFEISSVAELHLVAKHLQSLLSGRDVVLLYGPMGVGKTELVRALVTDLRGEDITSPTFSIHNNYLAGKLSIDHLDLFRIEGEDDLESTGFWDLFDQPTGLVILEWSEKIDVALLPRHWKKIKINLDFGEANLRKIKVSEI